MESYTRFFQRTACFKEKESRNYYYVSVYPQIFHLYVGEQGWEETQGKPTATDYWKTHLHSSLKKKVSESK